MALVPFLLSALQSLSFIWCLSEVTQVDNPTANCLWVFWRGGEGLVPLVVGFGREVARCPFSPFLTVYCLNDPALGYSCLDSNLAPPRHEVWALAVPEEETHSLVRGQGVSVYFDIFTQVSYSEFCCPKAMRDRRPVGACLFLLLKRQSKRGRAVRSYACCSFAAGGDGRNRHVLLGEGNVCMCLAASPGSNRSGWTLQGLGRCRRGSGTVTELLCCVRGLLLRSFIFIANLESAHDQRG